MINAEWHNKRVQEAQSPEYLTDHITSNDVDETFHASYSTGGQNNSILLPDRLVRPQTNCLVFTIVIVVVVHRWCASTFLQNVADCFLDWLWRRQAVFRQSVSRRTCYCCFLPNMASEGKVLIVRIAVDIFCWLAKNPFSSWIIKQLLLQIYTKSFIIAWVEAEEE